MKYLSTIIIALIASFCANAQWANILEGENSYCTAFHFLNEDTGFVSAQGAVMRTYDGGTNWDSIPIPASYCYIEDIHFFNAQHGYLSGGAWFPITGSPGFLIMETNDGGNTWNYLHGAGAMHGLFTKISPASEDRIFFHGDHDLFVRTEDGGLSFDSLMHSPGSYPGYVTSSFPTATLGYELSQYNDGGGVWSEIRKTNDGGDSWVIVHRHFGEGFTYETINDLHFISEDSGFAVGNNGLFLSTTNGGATWDSSRIAPTQQELANVHFVNSLEGVVAFQTFVGIGIMQTTDGGMTWTEEVIDTTSSQVEMKVSTDGLIAVGNRDRKLFTKQVDFGTSISPATNAPAELKLYPNPTTEYVVLEINTDMLQSSPLIKTYDLGGRLLEATKLKAQKTVLDVSRFVKGSYCVEMSTDEGTLGSSILIVID